MFYNLFNSLKKLASHMSILTAIPFVLSSMVSANDDVLQNPVSNTQNNPLYEACMSEAFNNFSDSPDYEVHTEIVGPDNIFLVRASVNEFGITGGVTFDDSGNDQMYIKTVIYDHLANSGENENNIVWSVVFNDADGTYFQHHLLSSPEEIIVRTPKELGYDLSSKITNKYGQYEFDYDFNSRDLFLSRDIMAQFKQAKGLESDLVIRATFEIFDDALTCAYREAVNSQSGAPEVKEPQNEQQGYGRFPLLGM